MGHCWVCVSIFWSKIIEEMAHFNKGNGAFWKLGLTSLAEVRRLKHMIQVELSLKPVELDIMKTFNFSNCSILI